MLDYKLVIGTLLFMFADVVEELMGLDDVQVTERFRELELRRRRDEAELLALIAVADARGVYAADGHLTVKGWLRSHTNWSPAEANSARRKARLVNEHPTVGDALIDGHLGVAQVAELARVRANPRCGDELGEVIDQLVDYGEQLAYPAFCKVVKRWENLRDADGAHHDAEATEERRTASLHPFDGGIDLRASGGSAITSGLMTKIFEQFVESEFRADVAARDEQYGKDAPASLLPRSAAQRRFDALQKIFETAAAMPAGSTMPGLVLDVVVSQERFEYELAKYGLIDAMNGQYTGITDDLLRQYCETDNGIAVIGHDIIRAAFTGHVRRFVIDGQGVVVDVGRKRRLFTGASREALKVMIDSCEHIGCDIRPTSCQIDHISEWVRDGGATDLANGAVKCGGQNRNKHRLGITEARDANGTLVQYRPDGTPILPVGRRLRQHEPGSETSGIGTPGIGTRRKPRFEYVSTEQSWIIQHLRLVA
jgi:hypothetical protein